MKPSGASSDRRLKVLVATSWYPSATHRVEGIFVREQAKAISRLDEVTVVHFAGGRKGQREPWRVERETDPSLNDGLVTYRVYHRPTGLRLLDHAMFMFSSLAALRAAEVIGQPELIHAHTYRAGVPSAIAAKALRIPVVITEHSTAFARGTLGRVGRLSARSAFAMADGVVTVSEALRGAVSSLGIRTRFVTVPNVVDPCLFFSGGGSPPPAGRLRLLSVCLLDASHKKGIPVLLEALVRLKAKRTDWHLDVIGDGPARRDYERQATALGLADDVAFLGLRTKAEVAQAMRGAQVLVVSSRFETFSVVAAEALSSGVPVVCTQCGGPEEFVTPAVGATCPPGDPEALSGAIDATLSRLPAFCPTDIAQYAQARFSPTVVSAQLHALYRELIT